METKITKPKPRRKKKERLNLLITSPEPDLAIVEIVQVVEQLMKE